VVSSHTVVFALHSAPVSSVITSRRQYGSPLPATQIPTRRRKLTNSTLSPTPKDAQIASRDCSGRAKA
jgi:hypothetical protein